MSQPPSPDARIVTAPASGPIRAEPHPGHGKAEPDTRASIARVTGPKLRQIGDVKIPQKGDVPPDHQMYG